MSDLTYSIHTRGVHSGQTDLRLVAELDLDVECQTALFGLRVRPELTGWRVRLGSRRAP